MANPDVEQAVSRAGGVLDRAQGDERPLSPTVATKLLVPSAPAQLVERRRLLDALDDGIAERLVVLCAPAGSGKTALLSNWVASRELPGTVCWLSLDRDDGDPSRLLADVLSALHGSGAIEPGSALARLTPPAGARSDRFLPLLVNGLLELRSPLVLVLDDVHELTSSHAAATLAFLVRHAPPKCRLVLSGRADPPLPLGRLRMRGELCELRSSELAFDRGETAELCRRLELSLAEPQVELLWRRTEGWAAALRLAAVSLRGHPQPASFLRDFAGTDRAVADYLVTEVLASLPQEQREFMLRTSVLDAVNPELADVLTTGVEGGAALRLLALERSGVPIELIVDTNGHQQDSYRYHRLLRELLRLHLRHAQPEEILPLHRRAARWYADNGQPMAAIPHALSGEDWEAAGALIADSWLDLFLEGRSAEMRAAISRLPAEVIDADPRLAAAIAGSRLEAGEVREAERRLASVRAARTQAPKRMREQLELTLATVALHCSRVRVRVNDVERQARKLTRLADACGQPRRGSLERFALASRGATLLWAGDPESAAVPLYEGLALATENAHDALRLDCLAQLAIVHLLRGELGRAEDLSVAASRLADERGFSDGPAVAAAFLAAGAGAYARGEFERAEGLLSQGAAAAPTAEGPLRIAVGVMQAFALAAAGSSSAARGALKLRALRASADLPAAPGYILAALEWAEVRVCAAAGDAAAARASLATAGARCRLRPELLVGRASIELADGDPACAIATLAQAVGGGWELHPATAVDTRLLRALAEHARGDQAAAADALEGALALAEREPFLASFLVSGPAVGELLERQAVAGTAHPALLELLLDGVGARRRERETLVEPLTARELKILRYLPTMLSNAEIGAEIFVSLNTVKTHLRSIYRKLGARGRADAVERARRLGLLPSGIKRPRVVRRS